MRRFILPVLAGLLLAAAPARAADPVIAVVGDAVCAPGSAVIATACQQKAVSDLILRHAPARVLVPGDLQYDSGTLAAFNTAYATSYGRFKSITCAVPGNHEYWQANAAGFATYFGATKSATGAYLKDCPVPGAPNWTISGTDTSNYCGVTFCLDQEPWLKQRIAKAPTCEAVFFHIPRWSSGHGPTYGPTWPQSYPFYRSMWYGHGELILTGHVHSYERFAPQDPWGNAAAAGQRQIVVGTGGKGMQPWDSTVRNSMVRRNGFGALFITLHPSSYDLRFIATNDRVLDQQLGIPCRA